MLVRGSLGSKSIKKKTFQKKKRILPRCFLVLFFPYLVSCSSVSWEMSLWSPGLLLEQMLSWGVLLVFSWLSLVLWCSPHAGGYLLLSPCTRAVSGVSLGPMKPHGMSPGQLCCCCTTGAGWSLAWPVGAACSWHCQGWTNNDLVLGRSGGHGPPSRGARERCSVGLLE